MASYLPYDGSNVEVFIGGKKVEIVDMSYTNYIGSGTNDLNLKLLSPENNKISYGAAQTFEYPKIRFGNGGYIKEEKNMSGDEVISIDDLWTVFPHFKKRAEVYDYFDADEKREAVAAWKAKVIEAAEFKRGKEAYNELTKDR